jgi:hypothetical protein
MPTMPYDEYNDDFEINHGSGEFRDDTYEDRAMQDTVFDAMEEWRHGPGGDTWTQEEWFDMVHEIDNFHDYVDDEGNYHYSFDFAWESADGYYYGSGHASG